MNSALEDDFAAMEAAFKALSSERGDRVEPYQALAIARRYPKAAALSGATFTYLIGFRVKFDEPITIKHPWKSGLGLFFSKPIRFADINQLIAAYELTFTQTGYEREASGIAMIPFFHATFQEALDRGMTLVGFKAATEVAGWTAHQIAGDLATVVARMRR